MSSITIARFASCDDDAILLFGESASRREMLPVVRNEAKRRALSIVPCMDTAEAITLVTRSKALLLCIIAWHEESAETLPGFIEDMRRRQANPLLEIVVTSTAPLSDMLAARLRALRVTLHRRRYAGEADDSLADVLATAIRHAFEKRVLRSARGAPPLSPMRARGLVELAGVFGSTMERRNAVDLLHFLPPLRSDEVAAIATGKVQKRAWRRRRKLASHALR